MAAAVGALLSLPVRRLGGVWLAMSGYGAHPMKGAKHYFNHLLFNTDGSRFIFLHRWRPLNPSAYKNVGGFGTRMLTARPDGTDVRIVDPYGKTSHFIWRDPEHILAWAWHPSHKSRFYLYEDGTDRVTGVGLNLMTRNGHCTYLPDTSWILNDTYPQGTKREQVLYLYHVPTDRRYEELTYAPETVNRPVHVRRLALHLEGIEGARVLDGADLSSPEGRARAADHALAMSRPDGRFDAIDQFVTGVDVDTGIPVGQILVGHR